MANPSEAPADRLSTHVLDTARGRPAAGVRVELLVLAGEAWERLLETATNADGRTDRPLLAGEACRPGLYELRFHVGAYFGGQAVFLDVVPVRFRLTSGHTHVPLLVAPGGYTTYRGS